MFSLLLSFITPRRQHREYKHKTLKTTKHKKDKLMRLKMTTNELYAENMSISHLSP